jgi:hypothetical protein
MAHAGDDRYAVSHGEGLVAADAAADPGETFVVRLTPTRSTSRFAGT